MISSSIVIETIMVNARRNHVLTDIGCPVSITDHNRRAKWLESEKPILVSQKVNSAEHTHTHHKMLLWDIATEYSPSLQKKIWCVWQTMELALKMFTNVKWPV